MAKVTQQTDDRKPEADAADADNPAGVERWPTVAETETLHTAGFHYDAWRASWVDGKTDRAVTLAHALALAAKDLERRVKAGK